MKTLPKIASVIICLCSVTHVLRAQIPQLINYQGRAVVGTTNFDGSGQFKFALVNAAGTTTYWSNDGTSVNGSEPSNAVTLAVTKALYSVLLGDTSILNMTALPSSVFTNQDVRLRVWFNDGPHGSQLLTPDQRLAAVGYAFMADNIKDGAITSAKLAPGAVTAASIANGAVGSTQLASGLTLAGTTSGTFSGNLTGNASTATSATNFTGSLAGNVTGTQGSTVVGTVGGVTAANVASGANLANAATNANTPNAIVKRDAIGNFSAGTITASLSGNASTATSATTAGNSTNFTGSLAGDVTGSQGTTSIANGAVTNAKLAANAVNTTNIVNGAVTNAKVATDAVNTTNIVNGAVTSAKLDPSIPGGLWGSVGGDAYRGTGNVGIDTSSPQRPLQIGDPGVGSEAIIRLATRAATSGAGTTWEIGVPRSESDFGNQYYSFNINEAGGPSRFMVQYNTGNVGIGTVTPASRLDVQGAANFTGNVGIGANATIGGKVGIGASSPLRPLQIGDAGVPGSLGMVQLASRSASGSASRTWEFGVPKSTINENDTTNQYYSFGIFDAGIGGAPQFMIQYGTGNVGIGTVHPASRLDVQGAANFNGDVIIGANAAIGGNVGIGTPTPANKLDVQGNGNFIGNLGVGTTGATHGMLEVGFEGGSYTGGGSGFNSSSAPFLGTVSSGTRSSAIYANGDIISTSDFIAISDERVKNVIGRSDAARDLDTLLDIEITDYRYKDVIAHGDAPFKKVIAQQVEKVFPQAVKNQTGEVPDIYKLATINDGWIALATDLKKGERVKLVTDDAQGVYEVLEVRVGAFRTDFKSAKEKVFVYGREVKDFRNVDYDAIAMLNVSATQEMQREIECLKADLGWQNRQFTDLRQQDESQLAALRNENAKLGEQNIANAKRLAALETRDNEREARLTRLEISMPAAQPVANTIASSKESEQ